MDAVVEGTVLRAGDQVRITAQLIDASTDKHLWSQSYQGELQIRWRCRTVWLEPLPSKFRSI